MEMQLTRRIGGEADGGGLAPAGGGGNASQLLRECNRVADAADAIIDRICSGEAERFLTANRQAGGQ